MLNKEDTLALAWEHSEGSGKRYTFTEDSLFAFLKEFTREKAPSQDGPVGIIQAIDGLEGEDPDEFKEVNVWVDLPVGTKLYATRPAQAEQQPVRLPERKRTDHLPKEYKTMTVVRAGLEAYNRALDDVTALNATPIAQTAPQPEQSGLVEALEQYADDSNWCFDTCKIDRDIAKDALAAYHAALSAQGCEVGE